MRAYRNSREAVKWRSTEGGGRGMYAPMADTDRREHERIEIQMHTRMWLNEERNGRNIQFEGYAQTRDLAIGGTFLASDYLLPLGFPVNLEMRINDEGEQLFARGEVVHRLDNAESGEAGMGVIFTSLDAENRERLVRFFVSDRVRIFYSERFVTEFPHLRDIMSLQDIALIINLWEDKEGRLTALRAPAGDMEQKAHRQREVRATQRRMKIAK